jgi:putative transposase
VWGAEVIAGESLKSLKSEGRGRGAKGRWVHWRNNSQIRGALLRTLRYKCHLSGLRLLWQHPRGTTHTCPKCGLPAHTYASPALDAKQLDAGPWLRCPCGWNGARDYAAAINIALLGVASLVQEREHPEQQKPCKRPTMKTKSLNSESYTGSGLALRLPPTSPRGRLISSGKRYINGWITSVTLHSALPPDTMLRLCG